MSRVINPESASRLRTQLVQSVSLALRQLVQSTELDDEARDLAAFIAIALDEIYSSIDSSVSAWEKRGYWIKADRYRMEWSWTEQYSSEMRAAVLAGDWMGIGTAAMKVANKLSSVTVAQRNRLGTPWVGAWERMQKTGGK
jgi:hypothetical protein